MIEDVTPALAFPSQPLGMDGLPDHSAVRGMTLRDWFATFAPGPSTGAIESEGQRDRLLNPHNEPGKARIRSALQIGAELRYRFADAMLQARSS